MRQNKTLIFMLGFMLIPSRMVLSQGTIDQGLEIIEKLNSNDDAVIYEGYWLLVNNDGRVKPAYRDNRKINNSLWRAITFLAPEPAVVKFPEAESSSTIDYLLYIAGDVRETRAIPYLLKNIHDAGFRNSLARMGDEAVEPVLKMFESGSETEKQYAIEILGEMVAPKLKEIEVGYIDSVKGPSDKLIPNSSYGLYEASGTVREKIKQVLKKQFYGKPVNLAILSVYKYVADEDDVKFLEDIAKNNTHKVRVQRNYPVGTPEQIKEKYPLREEAQKALDYIKKNKLGAQFPKTDVKKSTVTQ